MKTAITTAITVAVLASTGFALDGDILTYAKDHPAGISYLHGPPVEFGNPRLAKAAKRLSDIPRPWTVTKMISIYNRETKAYLHKPQERADTHDPTMWQGAMEEEEHCGHLAAVLAASRDPRAIIALTAAFERAEFPGAIVAFKGLYDCLVIDVKNNPYKRLPPDPDAPEAYTNFYPEMIRQVKTWWALNKEQITKDAESLSR
jgi:hypothetical protein